MIKIITMSALALALNATALEPSLAQTDARSGHMMGMAGGSCPMMGPMGQGMMGQGMMGQGPMGHGSPSGTVEPMGALADRRLAHLKIELKITDGQTDVWNAYTEAVKARATVMQGLRTTMMDAMAKGSVVERMDIRIKSMEAMVESMKAVRPTTDKLYGVLSAEQKLVADKLMGTGCGAM